MTLSKDQYIYPAVITKNDEQLIVSFPDLEGCSTSASTIEEGFINAKETLAMHLYELEEKQEMIPEPSDVTSIKVDENQFVTLIETWMPPYRKKMENQAVKKTLTIPKWLDDAAKDADLNYSRILQDALKDELNMDENDRSFSVQEKLNKQLKKVKKSIRDLSKIRVHVNMADDEDTVDHEGTVSNSVKKEIENVKKELHDVADRVKNSDDYQRLNSKINHLLDKLNKK
ncbi:type II toxin-antitoxin system HicB family antitoxin [Sporolactobacillus kofuensis]|uniref:Type II toxin-antitoxin system HicB family antitoxin n=1 Tax=Sporolactobacillus kofuensis TaxID=269672 RepID=A0ABW1WFI2_9BACL|nr:type II toxin-antitoxin system HicB family antitoxin [Sporolactobacillus kofuensis]MCO7176251.1 type II toxin-antitoxin system HicB family antitoxin [Sporolactobacillus kofuensis]